MNMNHKRTNIEQALNLACKLLDNLSPSCPSGTLDFLFDDNCSTRRCDECWKDYLISKVINRGEKND